MTQRLRLAELMAALSLATDLGMGQPMEQALRTCLVATELADSDLTLASDVEAGVLARLFGDIRIQRYPGIHHFVPPDQIYTPAHAKSLLELWHRAEAAALAPELSLQQ